VLGVVGAVDLAHATTGDQLFHPVPTELPRHVLAPPPGSSLTVDPYALAIL
jgi:hypothetical protein